MFLQTEPQSPGESLGKHSPPFIRVFCIAPPKCFNVHAFYSLLPPSHELSSLLCCCCFFFLSTRKIKKKTLRSWTDIGPGPGSGVVSPVNRLHALPAALEPGSAWAMRTSHCGSFLRAWAVRESGLVCLRQQAIMLTGQFEMHF